MRNESKCKRWSDVVAEMPELTPAQITAVKDIVDYWLSGLISDHPPVDDAMWHIQEDLDGMGSAR